MNVYIFTGPTLPPDEARSYLDAVFLPPVSQGDVYRAALKRPDAIGIIDGYFERVPSVWHKEILWAMKQGIHMFGSASMGALRAVELEAFGMEGVGAIYEWFRGGELEDDDEVAVRHGPVETGYRVASEAMVNIRSTLKKAHASGVIGEATQAALLRIAKDLFYPERCYPEVLRQARLQGLPAEELSAFEQWLPAGQIDQKREDALAMLALMRERLSRRIRSQACFLRAGKYPHLACRKLHAGGAREFRGWDYSPSHYPSRGDADRGLLPACRARRARAISGCHRGFPAEYPAQP